MLLLGVCRWSLQHWPENWNRVAAPVFRKQLGL